MPIIKVRIADIEFLQDRVDQQPTINSDMLAMAGGTYDVEQVITADGWYRINGWVWDRDWFEILEGKETPVVMPPMTSYDIDKVISFIGSQTMPAELEYITIAGPDIKSYAGLIGHYHFRLEQRPDTGFFVKFKGSVEYNISPYFASFTFRDEIRQMRDRIHEHLVVEVVKNLSTAVLEFHKSIEFKYLYRTEKSIFTNQDSISIFGEKAAFAYSYDVNRYNNLSKMYNVFRKATRVFTFDIDVVEISINAAFDTINKDEFVIIDSNNHFVKLVKRDAFDIAFPYIPYKKDDILGFYYATPIEPIDMFVKVGFADHGRERILKMSSYDEDIYTALLAIVNGSGHRLSQYPRGYFLSYQWYTKDAYDEEITKFDKLKKYNIELKGDKFVYTPTGRYVYNDTGTEDTIQEYDYEPDINFFGDTSDLHLGVELEIDKGGENHFNASLVMLPLGWQHAYVMHDGSLNNGFEIATMPMTLSYAESIRSKFADMLGVATHLGYHSHNTSTCGLHVHFDRSFLGGTRSTQNIKAGYLTIIMERNWEKFVQFSRRNYDRIDQWAAKKDLVADLYADDTDNDLRDKFANKYINGDKYVALNTNHSHTFELRIFRGTLKLETLFATMQFVDNLVRIAKDCPSLARAQQITFADIINYNPHKDLVDYVDSRGILTRNYIEYRGE